MASQIIEYNEEMVGANHPTKPDTLSRALLVEHNNDGTHKYSDSGTFEDANLVSEELPINHGWNVSWPIPVTVKNELGVGVAVTVIYNDDNNLTISLKGIGTLPGTWSWKLG